LFVLFIGDALLMGQSLRIEYVFRPKEIAGLDQRFLNIIG